MSIITMQRQIDRLATTIDQIKPRPLVKYKLIGVPPDDATDEAKAVFKKEFDAAQAAGVFVIQLVGVRPDPTNRRWQRPEDRQSLL